MDFTAEDYKRTKELEEIRLRRLKGEKFENDTQENIMSSESAHLNPPVSETLLKSIDVEAQPDRHPEPPAVVPPIQKLSK